MHDNHCMKKILFIQVFATIFINNAIQRKLYYMMCS
ncbi:hypothetical protein T4C_8436 [Trichinella pseudospiralis]|uniref:Uncharacterized protein n=1 Tax=Trichinella pseudospiralis TaxID=6337 RepID=A0A0V1GAY0_TRIPS|nr:hypothetical protein T4C_8436 [Trichinella pseudospiralis]